MTNESSKPWGQEHLNAVLGQYSGAEVDRDDFDGTVSHISARGAGGEVGPVDLKEIKKRAQLPQVSVKGDVRTLQTDAAKAVLSQVRHAADARANHDHE